MTRGNFLYARNRSRGFTLVAAIFLLVVLALLGAFMVTIGEAERWTTVEAAQGARAYQAAQAGIEWGVAQAVGSSSCAASTGPFTLTGSTFGGFGVTVTCGQSVATEGGTSYNVYAISSTAAYGALGKPDYFSRTLQVTVTDAPTP
jgi:MSHA biogenesis protein MshP